MKEKEEGQTAAFTFWFLGFVKPAPSLYYLAPTTAEHQGAEGFLHFLGMQLHLPNKHTQ